MSDTVFILGAGASSDAGCPVMSEFLNTARYLFASGKVDDVKEHFETVFRAIGVLQAVHSKSTLDLTNVESVFACFELAKTLDKFPRGEEVKFDDLIRSLKTVIARTIECTLNFQVKHRKAEVPVPYDRFVELIRKLRDQSTPPHPVSIITFNYDLACDYALFVKGIPFDYALENSARIPGAVPLLKLHGSLNWTTDSTNGMVVDCALRDCFSPYKAWTFDLDIVDGPHSLRMAPYFQKLLGRDKKNTLEPVIVPPTWNKGEYHKSVACVWAAAARELTDAKNIIVIGYSLPRTDVFFHYLYALGTVGEQPLQRFWVFDPDPSGEVKKGFRALLGPGALKMFDSPTDKVKGEPLNFAGAIGYIDSKLVNHV